MSRNTEAIIDLEAIKSNYQLAQKLSPNSKNVAVIKANGYGHGMIEVAHALEDLVPAFAVGIFDEAVILRDAGITKPIVILQGLQTQSELEYANHHDCWLMVHNSEQVELLVNNIVSPNMKIWLKLDSGMHRLGFEQQQFLTAFERLSKKCAATAETQLVLCSHFSDAANLESDSVQQQLDSFNTTLAKINGTERFDKSLANSAAIMGFAKTHSEWNRPGIMLYGISPFDRPQPNASALKSTMALTSEVVAIRQVKAGEGVGYSREWVAGETSMIATVCIGYADGYPLHAKSGTPVLVAGQAAELVGRVSMDMISVNVSSCENVSIGDRVEVWGPNLDVAVIAEHANTIGYELLTGVSSRVPRNFK